MVADVTSTPLEVKNSEPRPKALNIGFDEDPLFDSKDLFAKKPKLKNQSLLQQKLSNKLGSKSNSILEAVTTKSDNLTRLTATASVVVEPLVQSKPSAAKPPKGAVIEIFEE